MLKPTPSDIEGPFYKEGAPYKQALFQKYNEGFLCVDGKVLNQQGRPIDAVLDVWQADENGEYDLDGYKFRGKVNTQQGAYRFFTVVPGEYKLDEDRFRCPHIHVKVSAFGFKTLITQLYFADNKYNETDQWFDKDRILPITPGENVSLGEFNFVLEAEANS